MRAYPVFLTLSGCRVLVLGAGSVGLRKVHGLIPCEPAEILVLDTDPARKSFLPDASCIRFVCRPFEINDLDGRALVFAASADRELNMRLASLCRERSIFCNVADAPDEGGFHVPSQFVSGDLAVAFSTGGGSPALARHMAREAAERYTPLLTFLTRLRPLVLSLDQAKTVHAELFRALVNSPLGDRLRDAQGRERAEALVRELLPSELHGHIPILLQGFF